MLFTLKSHASFGHARHLAEVFMGQGHKVFIKYGKPLRLFVPTFNQEHLSALTRWINSTIEPIEPADASFDPIKEGFMEADTVLA